MATLAARWAIRDASRARAIPYLLQCNFATTTLNDDDAGRNGSDKNTTASTASTSTASTASTSTSSTIDFGFQNVARDEKQNLVRQVFSSVAPS